MDFKSFELEPNDKNILQAFVDDSIGRTESVCQFVSLCNSLENGCSISLDARWGFGKTFFVKQAKLVLDSFNPNSKELSEDEKERIRRIFSTFIQNKEIDSFVTVYYDAWVCDNDSDPILSLIYSIIKAIAPDEKLTNKTDFLELGALVIDSIYGKNASDYVKLLRDKDALTIIKTQKSLHENIAQFLDSILIERGNRLVIFIDELDRCRPDYAVRLLERIKHYFSNERITFVFSTCEEQLQHTIRHFYGDGFDACRYLERFFDLRIELPEANMERYYASIDANASGILNNVSKKIIKDYSFSLREIEKYYRIARTILNYKTSTNDFFGENERLGFHFALYIVAPLMIALRMTNMKTYYEFIDGQNPKPLLDLLSEENNFRGFIGSFLESNETFGTSTKENVISVNLDDKINQAYKALFGNTKQVDSEGTSIGKYSFIPKTINVTKDIINLLGQI